MLETAARFGKRFAAEAKTLRPKQITHLPLDRSAKAYHMLLYVRLQGEIKTC